ncbi:MAG: FAD binding domain-containing protein [Anaerolineae bacterium]|jgi:xanthine dehydrogenase iron-sulfur cluster and FAD-binding subunit A
MMWHTYYTPSNLNEALALLAEHASDARIIAGGTDLILELERGIRQSPIVVDVTRIPGLDTIRLGEDGLIHLGPLVTHNQVVGSQLCVERAFPLAKACWKVGAPQIRNRGTIAGNLITASPANDTITPIWAMEGQVTLKSVWGERTLAFQDFFRGVRKTDLKPDEMLIDIAFHPLKANERGTFVKLGLRQAQAISVVNVALILTFDDDLRAGAPPISVVEGRITLGSVAPTVVRARDAERALAGQRLTDETIKLASDLAATAAKPIDDVRGSANYRKYMVSVYTRRALEQLHAGAEREAFPARPVMLWGQTEGRFPTWASNASPADLRPILAHSEEGGQAIETRVNGQSYLVRGANDKTLLRMLREDIGLIGTKEGCAEGECGACTVLLDGIAVMSCLVPAPRAHRSEIVTIEGLATPEALHPIQQAFVEEGAVQCGYCTPGFIMSGASLLDENSSPTLDEIKQAITGNLCRCTGYYKIISAIEKAARFKA